jgi:hypothetical protein
VRAARPARGQRCAAAAPRRPLSRGTHPFVQLPPPHTLPAGAGRSTHGGVPKFSFEEARGECTCDAAYAFPCRQKTYAHYMGPADLVCPTWRHAFVGTHMSLHDATYFTEHDAEVYGVMHAGGEAPYAGSIVVLGLGLHDALDAAYLIRDVYKPAIERAREKARARVVCMLLPAPDEDKKPEQYRESQGRASILAFNDKIRTFCRGQGAEVLELYAPSANATSYDGTHYSLATNALFGQLFLNSLVHSEWEAVTGVMGEGLLFG